VLRIGFAAATAALLMLGAGAPPTHAEDRTVVELTKLPILEIERDLPQSYDVEFLGFIPWTTLLRNQRDGRRSSFRLLALPFGTFFASDRNEEEVDVRVVQIPFLGSLYRHAGDRGRYRTEILFWLHIDGERNAGLSP
jgi:hypothetical protein